MDDLVAFLHARLDEIDGEEPGWGLWYRIVDAMRAILRDYVEARDFYNRPENMRHPAGEVQGLLTALHRVAAVFGDHPDYRPEWAPHDR